MRTLKNLFFAVVLSIPALSLFACGSDQTTTEPKPQQPDTIIPRDSSQDYVLAKGADVSWVTEMESDNYKFYTQDGTATECMALLKSLGMNAIRLRVWVNPADGWCGKADVLAKAKRASLLGLRILIDFHYSDTWADPGQQSIPAAWANDNLQQMQEAVSQHTTDVLSTLKNNNIDVEWVQVGNETNSGMLWPMGKIVNNDFGNMAKLVSAGYKAVKAVYPNAKVILHVDKGDQLAHITWFFDGMRAAGAKWDIIGLSLYPDTSSDDLNAVTDSCMKNIPTLAGRYDTNVMFVEVGLPWDYAGAETFFNNFMERLKVQPRCLGIFYWEPEAYNNWKGYSKGAFSNEGKPMPTLNAF